MTPQKTKVMYREAEVPLFEQALLAAGLEAQFTYTKNRVLQSDLFEFNITYHGNKTPIIIGMHYGKLLYGGKTGM
jgi:hypothetical protein